MILKFDPQVKTLIHISLERWNFIVSLHLHKPDGKSMFFCAGSILTRYLGEKILLVLTDTGHSSQIVILRLFLHFKYIQWNYSGKWDTWKKCTLYKYLPYKVQFRSADVLVNHCKSLLHLFHCTCSSN